ncbi:MAG: 3-oxoacid CoA-transferase subunit A [Clostridia bacterium]|nr:3-oxoacid CoA-transferase subunit A [Clostridia bacterium]
MNKVTTIEEAISRIKPGSSIMIGGFGGFGIPGNLVNEVARQNIGDLTIIAEDFSDGYKSYLKGNTVLLEKHLVKKAIISFAGGQPRVTQQVFDGTLDLELVPQGTLIERIRAGAGGIGGFYTPVGVGTVVAEGKETREIDGKLYLLEKPLWANVALVKAYKADTKGNAIFKYNSISFNPVMAMAADLVILEAEEVVEPGEIEPDRVQLPGVFVDLVVEQKQVAL